jgi:DNA-binding NtrC family response regulator
MPSLLIVEDEKVIRRALRRLLERHHFSVAEAESIPDAEQNHELSHFDLIITDLRLPGPPGTELITRCPQVPILIMTSYASVKSAVDAMHQGAADYIAKPFEHDEFLHAINRILEKRQLRRQNAALKSDLQRNYPVAGIVGDSEAMQQVFAHISKVAPTDSTVLILGESGTGKELVARAVHEHSQRRDAPLIAVNCAAIPESLIESELFGHEKGAFTGAVGSREGLVEAANGGTLFLDEIGELPLAAQARLLRVLNEGEIRRVGSARTLRVNIRLMAATHRNLEHRVQENLFRGDLYYRLRVMEIRLPPLRERGADIEKLAHFTLNKVCQRLNRNAMRFSAAAIEAICHHSWPGNVREMENAIERAVILCENTLITAELLALEGGANPSKQSLSANPSDHASTSLDDYFQRFVLSHQNHLTETELARRLGISRKSLWERRQRLGIPKPHRKNNS